MESKENILSTFNRITRNKYKIYKDSFRFSNRIAFFIVKDLKEKSLIIIGDIDSVKIFEGISIIILSKENGHKKINIKKSPLSFFNLKALQYFFPYLNPVTCKIRKSFGTGDRLGMVTAAHIEAFNKSNIFPIIAQQSVRELNRTQRSWKDVMASAVWGYFESGSSVPFGSDADHVKEKKDLEAAIDAGFTMYTIDPSDYIIKLANISKQDIENNYTSISNRKNLEARYNGKEFNIGKTKISMNKDKLMPIAARYMKAVERVKDLYDFLKNRCKEKFDFEVSMDEIEEPVTPLEHYFISCELTKAGVGFNNLALRYPGRWEKAVDYIGDIDIFETDLKAHCKIASMFGEYKLSLHSGSEKLSAYPVFSKISEGNFHIKTAGTSYLEAIKVVSEANTGLFREIYALSLESFEKDRDSYHLTTDTTKLMDINSVGDLNLKDYLDIPESRQMLHVAFGTILANHKLKQRLCDVLFENEGLHYKYVKDNTKKHLDLLS